MLPEFPIQPEDISCVHGIVHTKATIEEKPQKMSTPSSTQQLRNGFHDQSIDASNSQAFEGARLQKSKKRSFPRRIDIFLHAGKTITLIGKLIADRRVPLWRKLLFFGFVIGLLCLLLFPDVFDEVVLSTILPLIGTVLGVPLDAGFDWLAFALAVVSLLHFFPAELVGEHYRSIFSK
jgi:hypothetical protein